MWIDVGCCAFNVGWYRIHHDLDMIWRKNVMDGLREFGASMFLSCHFFQSGMNGSCFFFSGPWTSVGLTVYSLQLSGCPNLPRFMLVCSDGVSPHRLMHDLSMKNLGALLNLLPFNSGKTQIPCKNPGMTILHGIYRHSEFCLQSRFLITHTDREINI